MDLSAPFNPLSSPNRNQGSRDFNINFDPLALDEDSHILDGFQSTGDDLLDQFFDYERHRDVREQKVEYEVETQKEKRSYKRITIGLFTEQMELLNQFCELAQNAKLKGVSRSRIIREALNHFRMSWLTDEKNARHH